LQIFARERERERDGQAYIINVHTRAEYTKYQLNKSHNPIFFIVEISDNKAFFYSQKFLQGRESTKVRLPILSQNKIQAGTNPQAHAPKSPKGDFRLITKVPL
jgi:hypothetical protein